MSSAPSVSILSERVNKLGERLIEAIENQTKAMNRHSKSLTKVVTRSLVFATGTIAIVTVANVVAVHECDGQCLGY